MPADDCIEQINSDDLPKYTKPTIPEGAQVIILVEEPNYDFGGNLSAAYRLDLDRILPNSSRQGVTYSIHAEGPSGADISVPENTVVPAYVEAFDPYSIKRAIASSDTTTAKFLIISLDQNVDDNYIIQSHGFLTFPDVHGYDIGQIYYLSDSAPGGVTNVAPVGIAQPLFYVVDTTTIEILIGL